MGVGDIVDGVGFIIDPGSNLNGEIKKLQKLRARLAISHSHKLYFFYQMLSLP